MKYYYVCNPEHVLDNTVHIVVKVSQLSGALNIDEVSPFLTGRRFSIEGNVPISIVGSGELFPFSIHFDGIIANRRIAEKMETQFGSEIVQMFPIECNERPVDDFTLVNIMKVIDCVDPQRSQTVRKPNNPNVILAWRSIFLDVRRIPEDAHLFRILGMEDILVVSTRGKELLLKCGISEDFFDSNYVTS